MPRNLLLMHAALAGMLFREAVVEGVAATAPASAPAATTKSKPEAEKVTMEDSRVVEFAGKRKMLKDVFIPGVVADYGGPTGVRFDFRNGKTRFFALPEALVWRFAAHGASQKIGDETAGEEDVDDMVLAVDEIIEQLNSGEWTAKREGGGFGGVSVLMKALMEHSGKDETTVKAFLKPKSHGEKMALRQHPPIKLIVDRLEAEKVAKAAGAAKVNAAELLGTLV